MPDAVHAHVHEYVVLRVNLVGFDSAFVVALKGCTEVRVMDSRNASEGTRNARWDSSEPEKASTGAADMSASRVEEVGDGVPLVRNMTNASLRSEGSRPKSTAEMPR